jgi:hypothetical protein
MHALPTHCITYSKDVQFKLLHWGLQEHQLRLAASVDDTFGMRGANLTFSVDEMAIDQSVTHTKIGMNGAEPVYRLDGFANCCDTAKYGPAQQALVSTVEDMQPALQYPIANQAFIGLLAEHCFYSKFAVGFISLTDGTYVPADIIQIFHQVETAAAKVGLTVGNFAADNLGPQLAFMQGLSRPWTGTEDAALIKHAEARGITSDSPPDAWLPVAMLHNRSIFQVKKRALALMHDNIIVGAPNDLCIPIDGWPHAFNRSASGTVAVCVSPEY